MAGVDHQSRGLVDHQQIFIFIDDIEGDILGDDLEIIARTIHHDAYDIARFHLITRLDRASIHDDALSVGSLLNPIARSLLHPLDEKLIDAEQLLTLIGDKTEMLEELSPVVENVGRGYGAV